MKTDVQIALMLVGCLAVLIARFAFRLGYNRARRDMCKAIDVSGVVSADGVHFYRVEKITQQSALSRPRHALPTPLLKQ